MFNKLKIFSDDEINAICDELYKIVGKQNLWVCGGLSRVLYGENHQPKDIDFVTSNEIVFKHLLVNIKSHFPNYDIKTSDKRIILYTPKVVIEIWNGKTIHYQSKHIYKGILPYLLSNRTSKN